MLLQSYVRLSLFLAGAPGRSGIAPVQSGRGTPAWPPSSGSPWSSSRSPWQGSPGQR